jgi:CelD/BcsL family acetyltransferase involved in cellulose biosynthesis
MLRGSASGLGRPAGRPFAPFEHGGLTVNCFAAWPTDDRLLGQWDTLSRDLPEGTALHSPVWQAANFRASGARTLRLITVHRGNALLAVVPTQLSDAGGLGTIGFWMTDYLDPLVRGPDAWRPILTFLAAHWDRRINEVVLHNIRASAALRKGLPPLVEEAGFTCVEAEFDAAPTIELPASWDEYLATLDAHERKEIRRKLNKAETKGGATLTRATDPADVPRALNTALDLMQLAGGEKGESIRQYVRPLLTEAGPPLIAGGRMELLTLSIEGRPAGCLIQFPTPAGVMLYNSGHDPALREWSPGVVALAMAIREAIARGAKTYDLLRGREPYKYRLGAVDRPLYRVTLRRK